MKISVKVIEDSERGFRCELTYEGIGSEVVEFAPRWKSGEDVDAYVKIRCALYTGAHPENIALVVEAPEAPAEKAA